MRGGVEVRVVGRGTVRLEMMGVVEKVERGEASSLLDGE